jgi:omega-6 fatty acid desaturase / acyl-lipid omega-6 desaturase (Delta-12 desaturase)
MSASTATGGAPHLTSASQRKPQAAAAAAAAAASPSGASTAAAAPATKYSHRQAKAYKPSDLPQFNVPDLTVKELLSAIPAHCFERSAVHSFAYVFFDFALVAALAYAASWIDPLVASTNFASSQNPLGQNILAASTQATALRWSLWGAYTFLQGLVFTGIWVIAHECGHQAFSTSKTLNNAVGWVLHSALLVPYHSWRISHARHHAATGHLTRDEVFVPRTRAQKGLLPLKPADAVKADAEEEEQVLAAVGKPTQQDAGVVSAPEYEATGKAEEEEEETFGEWLSEVLEDAPLFNLVNVLAQQLFGWPLYLIQNSSGQSHYPKGTNRE